MKMQNTYGQIYKAVDPEANKWAKFSDTKLKAARWVLTGNEETQNASCG